MDIKRKTEERKNVRRIFEIKSKNDPMKEKKKRTKDREYKYSKERKIKKKI